MQKTSIRELKHETSKVLALVAAGESVEVRRRNVPVAILSPAGRERALIKPDFSARMVAIYGEHVLKSTGTQVVGEGRGER